LYFAVLALVPEYLHDVLVESLDCGSVLATCCEQICLQLGLVEVNHVAVLVGFDSLPNELVHGHALLLQDVSELVHRYTPAS